MLRVSVTTYHTVVCLGNVMFDEEGRPLVSTPLRRGFAVVVVQICHGVHVVSCHLVDTRSTHWLT